ncbi:MAG: ParE-like toxin of type II toxin-antitoxin system, partial [Candidatus Kentron sp. G]
ADVKCLGFLYLYVGRYPRNNASRNSIIMAEPKTGRMKVGDLAGIRVYKFKVKSQLYLCSYIVDTDNAQITLLYFGTHENFYRDHSR